MQKNILKEVSSFLPSLTFFIFILLTLNACEDKKQKNTPIPIENTTEIFTQKDKKTQSEKRQSIEIQKNIQNTTHKEQSSIDQTLPNTYLLKKGNQTYTVTLLNKKLIFKDITQPLVLVTLSKSTCKPCLAQIKSLDKVSKKYQSNVFLIHLFEDLQDTKFIDAIHDIININPHSHAPLTIVFKQGKVYSYFEGLTPVEMILYDIQQAIKK